MRTCLTAQKNEDGGGLRRSAVRLRGWVCGLVADWWRQWERKSVGQRKMKKRAKAGEGAKVEGRGQRWKERKREGRKVLREAATMGNELWMVYTRSHLPLRGFHLVAALVGLVGLVALMHSASAHPRADSRVQYAGPTTPPQTHAPHLVRGSVSWPGVCAHFSCPVVFRPCVLIQSRPLPLTPIHFPSTIILDTPPSQYCCCTPYVSLHHPP